MPVRKIRSSYTYLVVASVRWRLDLADSFWERTESTRKRKPARLIHGLKYCGLPAWITSLRLAISHELHCSRLEHCRSSHSHPDPCQVICRGSRVFRSGQMFICWPGLHSAARKSSLWMEEQAICLGSARLCGDRFCHHHDTVSRRCGSSRDCKSLS